MTECTIGSLFRDGTGETARGAGDGPRAEADLSERLFNDFHVGARGIRVALLPVAFQRLALA
jgi:hypothetical protein